MDNHYHIVLDALTKASSQNAELLKVAEQQLKCWEAERGFYSTLLKIACDKSLDVNVRWLSVLCIKNGVDRYWRKTAPNAIASDEKDSLRQTLLTCFNEPINQIALQFALIISKIARFDFPTDWPELFPIVLSGIQSSDVLLQKRSLLIMHHVIKTLASKCLIADRRLFQQLTLTIFSNVLHLWINYSKFFIQEANISSSKLKDSLESSFLALQIEEANNSSLKLKELLERSFLTLKILRKLTVNGIKDCSKETDAVNFLTIIFQQIGLFLECRTYLQNTGKGNLLETCEKYIVLLVKILQDVVEYQPLAFVKFIGPTLECGVTLCFNKEYQGLLFEKLIVHFLNLMKTILLCDEYKRSSLSEDTECPLPLDPYKIKAEFFTFPVLSEICQQLISRYFLLSEEDIATWENNPEEFAFDEGRESWKFRLRPCTEVFFLALVREFRELLTSLVVEIAKNMHNNNSTDFLSILKKDAIYNAVGLVAHDLYNHVDFDSLFTNVLIPELKVKEPGYYIIRRRVIWLIGQWAGVKMSPEMRPVLYEVILQLLSSEDDVVVRLATANALKVSVDDFDFKAQDFLPFLEKTVAALFRLLKEVKQCDLKMSVLHVLSFIIEFLNSEVVPYADALMQYLPQLWENCGDHNMLRCAILSCLVHLVQALEKNSASLQPFLLPMIALSTDVSQPPHVYLMEDGLDLWLAVLENTTECNPELLNLAANLLPLFECSQENLKLCLEITEAYIVLSPENFLKRYGQSLVASFHSIITDLKSEGITMILEVIETAFIVFPEEGPVLFQPILLFVLSLAVQEDELPISLGACLSLLSRVILHNQTCFANLLMGKASECHKDVGTILRELLDNWLYKMPLINPMERKKLLGLALTALLTCNSDVVHDRICGVFLSVVEVLNDITRCDSDSPIADSFVNPEEKEYLYLASDMCDGERRKRELYKLDPVYTVALRDFLCNQVTALQQCLGATKFQDLMSTVDVETRVQLERYLEK